MFDTTAVIHALPTQFKFLEDYRCGLKGAPRFKIQGQLSRGFWQFLSDFDETWCEGAYGPYFNAGRLKLPDFCHLDPILAPRMNSWGPKGTKPY